MHHLIYKEVQDIIARSIFLCAVICKINYARSENKWDVKKIQFSLFQQI